MFPRQSDRIGSTLHEVEDYLLEHCSTRAPVIIADSVSESFDERQVGYACFLMGLPQYSLLLRLISFHMSFDEVPVTTFVVKEQVLLWILLEDYGSA